MKVSRLPLYYWSEINACLIQILIRLMVVKNKAVKIIFDNVIFKDSPNRQRIAN